MTQSRLDQRPFSQRVSWVALLVVVVIFTLFGIIDVIRGMDADPAIAESILGTDWEEFKIVNPTIAHLIDILTKANGASMTALSLISAAILLRPFRQGRQWAWFVMWLWPIWNVLVFVTLFTADRSAAYPPPPPLISSPIMFVITAFALMLSFRRFFPKTPPLDSSR